MALVNLSVPTNATFIPVDTRTTNLKVLLLPTASTMAGRMLTIKDYYGTASVSSFVVSTTGTDYLEGNSIRVTMSNSFATLSLVSDGIRTWSPYSFYTNSVLPFSPLQIAGCRIWLDSADTTTFTGGTTWFDKSGLANHAINTGVAGNSMPTVGTWPNGLQAATFTRAGSTSGTSMMTTITSNPANNYTMYMAMRLTALAPAGDPNGPEQFIFINNVEGARQIKTQTTATFPATLLVNFTNAASVTLTTNVQQNQGFLLGYVPQTPTGTAYFNNSTTVTQTTLTSSTSRWYWGSGDNAANRYMTGQIGEIIVYNSVLSQQNRELVEGYLAWKWGLQSNLPSTHPFRFSAP